MVKICLDPGHGGSDPGAVSGKRYEKDDVLRLALMVKPLLEKQGVGVIMTRTADAVVTIANRCALANKAGCEYFLSIHRDAADATAYGISSWVISSASGTTMSSAQKIMDEVLSVTPTKNRCVNKGTPQNYADFGVNTQTNMASALLEVGFVTNVDDNRRFDAFLSQYAVAIARGLCKVVGVAYKNDVTPPVIDWQARAEVAEKERDELKKANAELANKILAARKALR